VRVAQAANELLHVVEVVDAWRGEGGIADGHDPEPRGGRIPESTRDVLVGERGQVGTVGGTPPLHGHEPGASITVRKVTDGVGVEKIFPLSLPTIKKIEVVKPNVWSPT